MDSDPVDADPAEVGFLWPKPGFFRAPGGRNETCATWYRWIWGGYRWIPGMQAIQMPEKENMQKGTSKATGDSSCISFLSQGHFRWLMPSHLNHDQPSSAKEEPKQPKPKQPKAKAEPKNKIPPPPPPPKAPMCKHAKLHSNHWPSCHCVQFLNHFYYSFLGISWDIGLLSLVFIDEMIQEPPVRFHFCFAVQLKFQARSSLPLQADKTKEGGKGHRDIVTTSYIHQVLKPVAWHLRFGKSMGI